MDLAQLEEEIRRSAAGDAYEHLRRYSVPARRRLAKLFPIPSFHQFLARTYELDIDIRIDVIMTGSREELIEGYRKVNREARYGLTLVEAGRRPLIILIPNMHTSAEDYLDTAFHEAIHSTGLLLQRFAKQPAKADIKEYGLEEVAAIYGAACLAELLKIDTGLNRQRTSHYLRILGRKFWGLKDGEVTFAESAGATAAAFLAKPPCFLCRWVSQTGYNGGAGLIHRRQRS